MCHFELMETMLVEFLPFDVVLLILITSCVHMSQWCYYIARVPHICLHMIFTCMIWIRAHIMRCGWMGVMMIMIIGGYNDGDGDGIRKCG